MSTELAPRGISADIEKVLVQGDLSSLQPQERIRYYKAVCDSVGLNPLTKPFDYINLNGKLTLYAKKDCTDQLRNIHAISLTIPARETFDGVFVVTARATNPAGRTDESTGAVALDNLRGEARANAMMKAETKAKRRVTLSICGLGLLDETEIETVPGATPCTHEAGQSDATGAAKAAAPAGHLPNARELRSMLDALRDPYESYGKADLYRRILASHSEGADKPKTLKAARACVAEMESILEQVKAEGKNVSN